MSAILASPSEDLFGVKTVAPARADREVGPAAVYALQAVTQLIQKGSAISFTSLPFTCVSGHPGTPISVFQKAWKLAQGGPLVGPGFLTRSRRIHPFTLLTSLYNQVPAALSSKAGMMGPCHNLFEGGGNWVDLLPVWQQLAQPYYLVVLASANQREEEAVRNAALWPQAEPLEGAIALLLDSSAPFRIQPIETGNERQPSRKRRNPVLDLALQLYLAFHSASSAGSLTSWSEVGQAYSISYRKLVS